MFGHKFTAEIFQLSVGGRKAKLPVRMIWRWIKKRLSAVSCSINTNDVCVCLCPQPLFSEDLGEPFTVLHSVSHVQAGVHNMEVLLLRVQKDPQETKGSGYSVSLEWITVTNTAGQGWCPVQHEVMRLLQTRDSIDS